MNAQSNQIGREDVDRVKAAGWTDEAIYDAITVCSLFKFYKALVNRKYRLLFSSSSKRRKPGPKGPSAELIAAIVE